jgi:L-cystine transport system permease protein
MNLISKLSYIISVLPSLLKVLPTTLYIMVFSLFFGTLIGLLLTFARLKKRRISYFIATVYISFMRGTPLLAQLFIVYFVLPQVYQAAGYDISGWNKSVFAIIALSLNVSAYLSEVMRSAYIAVDAGQREAALSIGMNGLQIFGRIMFPQAFAVALPNISNTFILLFKDTSLVFTIGIIDIMGEAKVSSARDYGLHQLEIFIAAALVYWVICFVLEKLSAFFEKRYKKGVKSLAK